MQNVKFKLIELMFASLKVKKNLTSFFTWRPNEYQVNPIGNTANKRYMSITSIQGLFEKQTTQFPVQVQ